MKAARVKGLKATQPLADAIERIVTVRLAELCAFMPVAEDPARVTELHDMRIAAKRLRYILEISSDLFGPYAAEAALRTKQVQGVLGDIHDCDVTLPLVTELAAQAQADDVAAVVARAVADGAVDLDPAGVAATAPNADAHRGLASMAVYLRARRELLFASFLTLWLDLEREGFRARLSFAIGERPPQPALEEAPLLDAEPVLDAGPPDDADLSHDDHVGAEPVALPSNEV